MNVLPGANAGEFIAVSEPVRATTRIDTASLAALGRVKYEDNMPGSINTVHPFILPSGDLINILTEVILIYRSSKAMMSLLSTCRFVEEPDH